MMQASGGRKPLARLRHGLAWLSAAATVLWASPVTYTDGYRECLRVRAEFEQPRHQAFNLGCSTSEHTYEPSVSPPYERAPSYDRWAAGLPPEPAQPTGARQ